MALPHPPPRALGAHAHLHAALPFEPPVRGIVHRAKYRGERQAGRLLGALVVERLWATLQPASPPELVIPVPLGRRRRRARGYNQAALLAEALAREARAPLVEHLVRTRDTPPQVGLHGDDRRANVLAAFAWRGPPLHGETLWLVDDVATTGATLAAAATALQQAGAGRIEAVAAAMVLPPAGVRIASRSRVSDRPGCGAPAPVPRMTVSSTAGDPQP